MSSLSLSLTSAHYDATACGVLDAAVGHAAVTRFATVAPAHILLAALQKDEAILDPVLRDAMKGLRASTLADALREELTIEADLNDLAPGDFPEEGLPRASDLSLEAAQLLMQADRYAEAWKRTKVPAVAIACAALETPDPLITRVLRGIGIAPEQCRIAVAALSLGPVGTMEKEPSAPVFVEGRLNMDAFEAPLLRALGKLAMLPADRLIVETDLLEAILDNPDSSTAACLRTMGADVETTRNHLRKMGSGTVVGRTSDFSGIAEQRISRLVRRIFGQARTLADSHDSGLISEAHLVLSHLHRVESVDDNIFVKLQIDTNKLREIFTPVLAKEELGVFVDGALRLEMFGPIAGAAWRSMIPIAGNRRLLDSDLLLALLNLADSRFAETLQITGAPVPTIRAALSQLTGKFPTVDSASKGKILQSQIGALLQSILTDAVHLATGEGSTLIGESHLLRAHIDKVAGSTGNVYERMGINVRKLYETLERNRVDRTTITSAKEEGAKDKPGNIAEYLNSRVVNQSHAVAAATKALIRMRSRLNEPGQVMGKFLFLGPTGVGKTELARAMSAVAFGEKQGERDAHMIRIDCGNFQNRWDVVQLIGASQGLVGYKEGQLTNGLKDKPYSIILFDEAEKANKDVWQSLLPLFDEGIVREADGTQYDATQCILVATSNVGYSEAIKKLNVWERDWNEVRNQVEEMVWEAMATYFSPEFLSRFGRENLIFFNHFSRRDYRELLNLQITNLIAEMSGRGLDVTLSNKEDTLDVLEGFAWESRQEGARPVRRLITRALRDPIIAARGDDPERSVFRFETLPGSGEIRLEFA